VQADVSGDVLAGVIVALAVIVLVCIVVVRLDATKPVVIAAVLTALAGVLATVPHIILALWGR
jgi:NAD(P)H-hydrate repair Nnr-like enzyme with NAD(P)H-hydrate dehydratase domain